MGIMALRRLMLEGQSLGASRVGWPADTYVDALSHQLDDLGLRRFCEGEDEVVDQILEDFLKAIAHGQTVSRPAFERRLRAWRREEPLLRARLRREQRAGSPSVYSGSPADEGELARALEQAIEDHRQQAVAEAFAKLQEDALEALTKMWREEWEPRARSWTSLADVFDDLHWVLKVGWDMSKSVLQHSGWFELERLQELLARTESIKELARVLGRWRQSEVLDEEMEIIRVLERVSLMGRVPITTSHVPQETRGVTRSGDVSRMLPVEAALLLHPKLRVVWHARRAERALNTYRVQGVMDGAAALVSG
jgi:uncharacterized protein with von Willebrand factor type A (vWA) domain